MALTSSNLVPCGTSSTRQTKDVLDLLTSVALSLSAFPHTPMANLAHGLVEDSMTAPFTELSL